MVDRKSDLVRSSSRSWPTTEVCCSNSRAWWTARARSPATLSTSPASAASNRRRPSARAQTSTPIRSLPTITGATIIDPTPAYARDVLSAALAGLPPCRYSATSSTTIDWCPRALTATADSSGCVGPGGSSGRVSRAGVVHCAVTAPIRLPSTNRTCTRSAWAIGPSPQTTSSATASPCRCARIRRSGRASGHAPGRGRTRRPAAAGSARRAG